MKINMVNSLGQTEKTTYGKFNDFLENLISFLKEEELNELNENVKNIREQISKKSTLNTWEEKLKKELEEINDKIKSIRKQKEKKSDFEFEDVKESIKGIIETIDKKTSIAVQDNLRKDFKKIYQGIVKSQIMCKEYVIPQKRDEIKYGLNGPIDLILEEGGVKVYKKGIYYFVLDDYGEVTISGYKQEIGTSSEGEKLFSIRGLSLNKDKPDLRSLIKFLKGVIDHFNLLNLKFISYSENPVIQNQFKKNRLLEIDTKEDLLKDFSEIGKFYIKGREEKYYNTKGKFYLSNNYSKGIHQN